jgi:hypothetical protein
MSLQEAILARLEGIHPVEKVFSVQIGIMG